MEVLEGWRRRKQGGEVEKSPGQDEGCCRLVKDEGRSSKSERPQGSVVFVEKT